MLPHFALVVDVVFFLQNSEQVIPPKRLPRPPARHSSSDDTRYVINARSKRRLSDCCRFFGVALQRLVDSSFLSILCCLYFINL